MCTKWVRKPCLNPSSHRPTWSPWPTPASNLSHCLWNPRKVLRLDGIYATPCKREFRTLLNYIWQWNCPTGHARGSKPRVVRKSNFPGQAKFCPWLEMTSRVVRSVCLCLSSLISQKLKNKVDMILICSEIIENSLCSWCAKNIKKRTNSTSTFHPYLHALKGKEKRL